MPISPVARQCLFDYYHNMIKVGHLQTQFNQFFKHGHLNPTQKGFYLERLLITLISMGKLKEVDIYTIIPGNDAWQKTKLVFKDLTVIDFGGYFAPLKETDSISQFGRNLLFAPTAYNYPGFDFFSYTPDPKAALFHQVTIMKECHLHVKSNDDKAKRNDTKAGTLPPAMRVSSIEFFSS
jgi:hypothetical protein